MNAQEQALFTDLCKVLVYHQADCTTKAGAATRRLIKAGIMEDANDWSSVKDKYDSMLEEYAQDLLPEQWQPTHDYWGAKCFAKNPGWNAPKSGTILTGDKGFFYMFFDSFQALKEYLEDEIKQQNNK